MIPARRVMLDAWGRWLWLLVLPLISVPLLPVRAQDGAFPAQDTLLVTPTTQGTVALPDTAIVLDIFYGAVTTPTHLRVTRTADGAITLDATGSDGVPLRRFETPLVVGHASESGPVEQVVGWPGTLDDPFDGAPAAAWLLVFDAHGVYAQPADPDSPLALYLGPLEHFSFDLVRERPAADGGILHGGMRYVAAPPRDRAILAHAASGDALALPSAAHDPRYRDRFIPEDLGNPGGFMLLGLAEQRDLPAIVRTLAGRIPDDPDIPAPGVPVAPIPLLLPLTALLTGLSPGDTTTAPRRTGLRSTSPRLRRVARRGRRSMRRTPGRCGSNAWALRT